MQKIESAYVFEFCSIGKKNVFVNSFRFVGLDERKEIIILDSSHGMFND